MLIEGDKQKGQGQKARGYRKRPLAHHLWPLAPIY